MSYHHFYFAYANLGGHMKKNQGNTKQIRWIFEAYIALVIIIVVICFSASYNRFVLIPSSCFMSASCMNEQLDILRIYSITTSVLLIGISIVFMILFLLLLQENRSKITKLMNHMNLINSNHASAIITMKYDKDAFKIMYGNAGFYQMHGYTKKQYRELSNGNPFYFASPKDQTFIQNACLNLQDKDTINIEYRVKLSDDRIRWFLLNGTCVSSKEKRFSCVISDITKHKRSEEVFRLNSEKLMLVMSCMTDYFVEYDLRDNTFTNVLNHEEQIFTLDDFKNDMVVHEEDYTRVLEIIELCRKRKVKQDCTIVLNFHEEQNYYHLSFTTLFDLDDEPCNVLIQMTNVDGDIKEKKALLELSYHDKMSGLYNKPAARELISESLSNEDAYGVIYMIDIDDFKKVNDSFGHEEGDVVIEYVARSLERIFPNDAIICRAGGDEFLIYLKQVNDEDIVCEKAGEICNAFLAYSKIHEGVEITCSIGIASCPSDGKEFDELARKADEAMYHCKKNGKNSFLFHKDM